MIKSKYLYCLLNNREQLTRRPQHFKDAVGDFGTVLTPHSLVGTMLVSSVSHITKDAVIVKGKETATVQTRWYEAGVFISSFQDELDRLQFFIDNIKNEKKKAQFRAAQAAITTKVSGNNVNLPYQIVIVDDTGDLYVLNGGALADTVTIDTVTVNGTAVRESLKTYLANVLGLASAQGGDEAVSRALMSYEFVRVDAGDVQDAVVSDNSILEFLSLVGPMLRSKYFGVDELTKRTFVDELFRAQEVAFRAFSADNVALSALSYSYAGMVSTTAAHQAALNVVAPYIGVGVGALCDSYTGNGGITVATLIAEGAVTASSTDQITLRLQGNSFTFNSSNDLFPVAKSIAACLQFPDTVRQRVKSQVLGFSKLYSKLLGDDTTFAYILAQWYGVKHVAHYPSAEMIY